MVSRSLSVVTLLTFAACGSGGGSSTPTQPTAPVVAAQATFSLRGAGYDLRPSYTPANGGLVFCRPQQASRGSYLWVRLAASQSSDGGAGPHVDLDLCNFSAESLSFTLVHDPTRGLSCDAGATWDIWWHDGARTFVSPAGAADCRVTVARAAGRLDATFQCRGLVRFNDPSTESLDILDGSFTCPM